MAKGKTNLFLILEVLKGKIKAPINVFFEKDYTTAKMIFEETIKDKMYKSNFELRKIGEYENNKFRETDIFITRGIDKINKTCLRKEREQIREAARQKEINKQIEILFEGKCFG